MCNISWGGCFATNKVGNGDEVLIRGFIEPREGFSPEGAGGGRIVILLEVLDIFLDLLA